MLSAKTPGSAVAFFLVPFLALGAAPALAQFSGYYVELSAGPSETEVELLPPLFSERGTASVFNAESEMASLTMGLRFNDTISVEVGYTDFGSFSNPAALTDALFFQDVDPETEERTLLEVDALVETEAEYEATAVTASLIGSWPLSRRWNVYGKLGLTAWDVESAFAGTVVYSGDSEGQQGVSADLSDTGSNFFYGAGLLYRFNLSYGAKLEYQRFKLSPDIFSSDATIDNVSVGLRLYF